MREVYGVSQQERATMGVVATTSYFTKDAQQLQRMEMEPLNCRRFLERLSC